MPRYPAINATMNFTDFVVHTGVEQYTLSRRGFAGVNMRRDTNVAVSVKRGSSSH